MRPQSTNDLIAQLAHDPAPVKPMRMGKGTLWTGLALTATAGVAALINGIAVDSAKGLALTLVMLTNALLALLGLSAAFAALHMAKPQAGARRDGPKWALAMFAVLPLVALADGLLHDHNSVFWQDKHGPACLIQSVLASLLVMAALTLWVRRGAPANPRLAIAYIGIASGAFGALAYGLTCPIFDMAHLFTWHAAAPFLLSGLAYFALPSLLRW